ncbi:MAG: undecaprenyl-diphosphate phosphatase [Acidobacteria bacterium]|nr:MAG: undecaprenyl-diphosphate phosphatase [Acidobacteriota bacterium]
MHWVYVVILSAVQGLAELLPISSSAHVIVVAKLLHENMSTPANALLLVMLHTGTMFAVIIYFWRQWVDTFFSSWAAFWRFVSMVFVACFLSGIIAFPLMVLVGQVLKQGTHAAEIETLFNKLNWISPALAAAGLLILWAGLREARNPLNQAGERPREVSWPQAIIMGILQGVAIPFRGFSRSGSTISGGLLAGGGRRQVESFSFAIVVAITPLAVAREFHRLLRADALAGIHLNLASALAPSLLGMVCAFIAGLLALKWLSHWLEQGRWYWFGIYCLAVSVFVMALYLRGW